MNHYQVNLPFVHSSQIILHVTTECFLIGHVTVVDMIIYSITSTHTVFNKINDLIIDVEAYIVSFQSLTFVKSSSTAHKQVHHSVTFFRISTNHLVGNLRSKIPMIDIGMSTALGSRSHQPETIDINI